MSLQILKIKESKRGIKILSFTDSSSALGWLHHSTFNPIENPLHDEAARYFATMLLDNNSSLYSQHIKGKNNVIADSLSRDFHHDDLTLISKLYSTYNDQMPRHFTIFQIPAEIISWIESLALRLTATTELLEQHEKSNLDTLSAGKDFSPNVLSKTHTSLNSHKLKEVRSSVLLQTQSGIMNLARLLKLPYGEPPSMPPSQMWLRPSEKFS